MTSQLEEMKAKISEFIEERDWSKFHNPKDLAIALSVESNELLEIFQWKPVEELPALMEERRKDIESEIADIMHFLIAFSNATGIDIYDAFMDKLEYNKKRYPKEIVKGKSHKYTYYQKKD